MGATIVPGTGSRRAYFPKYKINQGPFSGGVNYEDDPSSLGENELQECINYTLKPDGTLVARPPVTSIGVSAGLPIITSADFVYALGSVLTGANNLVPIICISSGSTYKFFKYEGLSVGWIKAFDDLVGAGPVSNCFYYNNNFYVLFDSTPALFSCATTTGTLVAVVAGAGADPPAGIQSLILKDRIFIQDGNEVYYSKATDPSNFNAPDGGTLGLSREDANDTVRDMVIFNNSLYICTYRRIYQLSFTTDPEVDGTLTLVTDTQGGFDMQVYKGNLFVVNGDGLYTLVNNYLVEVSQKVRKFLRAACRNLVPFGGGLEIPVVRLHLIGNLLLVGPLNLNAQLRFSDLPDALTGNQYLVYDLDLGIWFKWLFSANITDPISGPQQDVMFCAVNDPSTVDEYVWVGMTLVGGLNHVDQVTTLKAMDLNSETTKGYDSGEAGPRWVGGFFKLGEINLGDSTQWKRVFTSTLDAKLVPMILAGGGLPSVLGFDVDGNEALAVVTPTESGRISMAKAFRCKEYAMYYDSLTSTVTTPVEPELTDINEFFSWVQLSGKITAEG